MTVAAIIVLILALLCLTTTIRKDGYGAWGLDGFPWLVAGTLLVLVAFVILVVSL